MGKPENFYAKRKSVLNFNSDDWYVECPVIKAIKQPVVQNNIPPAPFAINKPEQTFVSQDMVAKDITTPPTDKKKKSKKGLFIGITAAVVATIIIVFLLEYFIL